MDAVKYKRTKIIATIGPATSEADQIKALLKAGVNGVRLNLSHGTHTEHAARIKLVRSSAKALDRSVALLADLQGPKIRLGSLPNGGVDINAGDTLRFSHGVTYAQDKILPIQYDFSGEVKKGQALYLRDGQIQTQITAVKGGIICAKALNSGKVNSNQGINLPDTHFSSSVITNKDKADIAFVAKEGVDYIALSFVQSEADIIELKKIIAQHKSTARVIAKIETKVATDDYKDIIAESDAVMVARGDLAIETLPEEVPVVQRKIIAEGRRQQTPVIIATQMLESMMKSMQPSRAEVSDIASAVAAGVDAVMLSGETATGNYPIETVAQMKKVIVAVEASLRAENKQFNIPDAVRMDLGIPVAAVTLASQFDAKVILAETQSGRTALNIASLRPYQPIIMASTDEKVCSALSIVWGSKPFLLKRHKTAVSQVIKNLKKRQSIKTSDFIVTAYGKQRNISGGTDTVRIIQVP